MKTTIVARIETIIRLKNSYYGNPRFEITFEDYRSFNTAADASFAYEIGNKGFREQDIVTAIIGNRDTIVSLSSAKGQS